ncbi:MAG: hypothetical protein E6J23_00050 [Chloroflexi bacterium]|nr:MAG: hypothetical protein E6J23_00050 [Chloroflexota bacterium]
MRLRAAFLALLVLASCGGGPPLRTGAPVSDLVIPTTVPNGKVEVVVKSTYTVGETIRATVRLLPKTGSLRGPLDPYVQASGFHGTATVRHLSVDPISVYAGAAEVAVVWDMRDDGGKAVASDDYSLVFNVIDDSGRTTTVGATLQVR